MPNQDSATSQLERLSNQPMHQDEYSTLKPNLPLFAVTELTRIQIILAVVTVRVHRTLLVLHPASNLWYLCRALDMKHQGFIVLSPQEWGLLGKGRSTICRWLFEGKKLGFFWCYSWRGNTLTIRLGGLFRICKISNIESWGATAKVPLSELLAGNRRAFASAITTQDLQQRSHYAATRQLNKLDRKTFRPPTVDQLLDNSQTSPKFTRGEICGVIGTGEHRIFVNQRFIPFGVSQRKVSNTLNSEPTSCGVSPRTIRRHLDQLGVVKRQLVQTKPEYREIRAELKNYLSTSYTCQFNKNISYKARGDLRLYEPNGITSSQREGGHVINGEKLQCKPYFGAVWIHRCNIYQLDNNLGSMKYSRYLWKKERLKTRLSAENSPPPKMAESLISPKQPPALLGRGAVVENKVDKNENLSNVDGEMVSDGIPSCWHEIGEKLRQVKQKQRQAKTEALTTGSLDPIREYWRQVRERS